MSHATTNRDGRMNRRVMSGRTGHEVETKGSATYAADGCAAHHLPATYSNGYEAIKSTAE
jgi:hypothetical protein